MLLFAPPPTIQRSV